jgi:hypothetical protein
MYQSADRQAFEEARRNMIERALYVGRNPDEAALKLKRNYSLRKSLVQDLTQSALEHARLNGLDVHAYQDLASQGLGIVNGLEYSLTENKRFDFSENAKPVLNWNFWKHDDHPHFRIQRKNFPYMDRYGIEQAATEYLELPYRAPYLERIIVDLLIGLELYAFSKEMLEKPPLGARWLNARAPLTQKHVLRRYIGGQFWGAVVFLGLAYLVGTYGPGLIGETASAWIAGAFVVLFILDFGFSTVMLPFNWRNQQKARRKVRDLMIAMAHTYGELSGDGQVSTRRLREVAAKAADQGVVWPKPLFLMLDDNIARSGRI